MRGKPAFLSLTALGAIALFSAGCATSRLTDAQELELYRAHAGASVKSFTMLDRLDGWTPLGDTALAVWTRPNEAFLLEMQGRCIDLDTAPAITVTHQASSVYAKFDDVLVLGGVGGAIRMPCRIDAIRQLDVKALRHVQQQLRHAKTADPSTVPAPHSSGM